MRYRVLLPSLAALALSCAPPQHAPSLTPAVPVCTPPATATKFDSSKVGELAGFYSLTLTADSFPLHGARTPGRLRLRANSDSQRIGTRPLVGTLDMNLDAIFAPYSIDPRSTDPGTPGIYFDMASGQFDIGVQPNISDGTSTALTPLLVWADGFQGRWSPNYGIGSMLNPATGKPAHVGGEFCAARLSR